MGMDNIWYSGIFLENKSRVGKLSLLKIEGGRTLIILKSILSLKDNSGGKIPPLHKSLGIVTYIRFDLLLVTFSLKFIRHMY